MLRSVEICGALQGPTVVSRDWRCFYGYAVPNRGLYGSVDVCRDLLESAEV